MLFYLQCVFYLVILPLPDPRAVAEMTGPYCELTPFRNAYDFIVKTSFDIMRPSTWLPALKEQYVLEPLFNLLLLLPFGVYLSYYFKNSLKRVALFSFLLSAFFELTQLSGLFFIYPRPYRLFDVNDLMTNTLGGVCGYFVYTRFLKTLPSKKKIDERSREKSGKVGFARRLAAMAVDNFFISVIGILPVFFIPLEPFYIDSALFFVYYPAFAVAMRGRTPGKALVKIRIERACGGRPPPLLLCARYIARNAFVLGFWFVSRQIPHLAPEHRTLPAVILLLAFGFVCLDILLSFRRNRRLWYELLSKTQNVSYFKAKE
jgi:glycopeptide antibiotics resistance protein